MNLTAVATGTVERLPLPDSITRAGIALLVDRTSRRLRRDSQGAERAFAAAMAGHPIALHPELANTQHYELPPEFFAHVLGPQRKYSCCLYEDGDTLAAAEERALAATAAHATLADGQRILELGCGWGSLSLWMAQRYTTADVVAVSNSQAQRDYIEAEARRRGLDRLRVVTADMNAFAPAGRFDRVVSVEMWEHMTNWPALLERVHDWLHQDGRLFLHVFSHASRPYSFDRTDKADWIAQHFFTGGIMPSHGLIHLLESQFSVDAEWRWSGTHYQRTAEHWLDNFDRNSTEIDAVLRAVYRRDAALWRRRWRLFFLATAGLFGAPCGDWGISRYRLRPL